MKIAIVFVYILFLAVCRQDYYSVDPGSFQGRVVNVARRGGDTADLQTAIDAAAPGDTIYLVDPIMTITKPIIIEGKSNLILSGNLISEESITEVLYCNTPNEGVLHIVDSTNVFIRDLVISNAVHEDTVLPHIATVEGSEYIAFEDVTIAGKGAGGLYIADSRNVTFFDSRIYGLLAACAIVTGRSSNVDFDFSKLEAYGVPVKVYRDGSLRIAARQDAGVADIYSWRDIPRWVRRMGIDVSGAMLTSYDPEWWKYTNSNLPD